MKRSEIIKTISLAIVNGKGIKINVDDHILRLEFGTRKPYMIWHDETDDNIAAIIYEEDMGHDFYSDWALI